MANHKKAVALALLALLVAAAAGCQGSDVAGNLNQVIAGWRPDQNNAESTVPEPSAITPLNGPSFDTFHLLAWPNDEALAAERFYAVDGWFGQIEYRAADERLFVLRVAPAGGKRLTTTYSESHDENTETFEEDGIEVRQAWGEVGCVLLSWEKNGFQYLLHSHQGQAGPERSLAGKLVAGLDAAGTEDG